MFVDLARRFVKRNQKPILEMVQVEVDRAFAAARAKAEAEFIAPKLDPEQRRVTLQRRWFLVYHNTSYGDLDSLVPSGITAANEIDRWFWGLAEETRRRYLLIVNTSWSNHEIKQRCESEGITDGLCLFDDSTRQSIKDGILKNLSD